MTNQATTRFLLIALAVAMVAAAIADSRYAAIADSRYAAIADTSQPADLTLPTLVDPVPTPVVEIPIAEPMHPVTPAPSTEDLSALGSRLSSMSTGYLPLIQRAEKYPPANRAYELEVLRLVNEQRAAAGLWPLVEDPALTNAARRHAMDMALNNSASHIGSDRSTAFQRMAEEGFAGTPWTEALSFGRLTPQSTVIEGWMASPKHRDIVLDRTSNRIGMGVYPIVTGGYAGTATWVIDLGVMP